MSTRAGTGIDLDDLLDEAVSRARDEVKQRLGSRQRGDELDEADVQRIAEQVGIGAVRYDIVSKQPTKAITFQWEEALDFEAQSAPYVQYVHARCCGILDEAERAGHAVPDAPDASALKTPEAEALVLTIARLTGAIDRAADQLEPHRVATYTRDIAETFNAFYRECPVLTAEDDEVRAARLALVRASRHTVANALAVLGVAAPESM
jgi:arginyl-tRNA synthetase